MKKKAVFLDRDGVINEDVDHLHKVADLRILPGVGKAIRALNQQGYLVIVISNQAAVARGITTVREVEEVHDEMRMRLAQENARIDAFYYCPHHPDGSVEEYAVKCECRKPAIGMIDNALEDFDIDLAQSFLVGDKTGDILTGMRAGLKTILVRTGYAGRDGCHDATPDFVADDLLTAIDHIK
jgi:mannose-1-phosphate guanylyltransferase / phosphomannomutase